MKKKQPHLTEHVSGLFFRAERLRSFNLAGFQAGSANVHFLSPAVNLHANRLDVRLPDMIGTSMRMAYIISKMDTLPANSTFRHVSTSLLYEPPRFSTQQWYYTKAPAKKQGEFLKNFKKDCVLRKQPAARQISRSSKAFSTAVSTLEFFLCSMERTRLTVSGADSIR